MKYIVFLTENVKCKVNGNTRSLIGVHKTDNPEVFDGYLGEGVWQSLSNSFMYPKTPFLCAVKKYGVESFRRILLLVCDTIEEAYNVYRSILNSNMLSLASNYNTDHNLYYFCINPLYQFDTLGNLVKVWESPEEAMNMYGYPLVRFYNASNEKKSLVNSFWSTNKTIKVSDYREVKTHNFIRYIYTLEGKLIKEFWNDADSANFMGCDESEIPDAIKNQVLINGKYFVLNYTSDLFTPRPRVQLIRQTFHVYNTKTKEYLGAYKGKSVMKVIDQHSWAKMQKIFQVNRGWYKDFFLSLTPLNEIPEREYIPTRVEVYTKYGNYIETLNSVKELKDKYKIPNHMIKRMQQGNKYFEDYIFKYSK